MNWSDPTSDDLEDPLFNAIWDVIKSWDIGMPYFDAKEVGYAGASGNHVMMILEALRPIIKDCINIPPEELASRLVSPISFERECARIIGEYRK